MWFILASPEHHISQSLLYLNKSKHIWNREGKKLDALCTTGNSFLPRLINGVKTKLSFCWKRSHPRYRLCKLPLRKRGKRTLALGDCCGGFLRFDFVGFFSQQFDFTMREKRRESCQAGLGHGFCYYISCQHNSSASRSEHPSAYVSYILLCRVHGLHRIRIDVVQWYKGWMVRHGI